MTWTNEDEAEWQRIDGTPIPERNRRDQMMHSNLAARRKLHLESQQLKEQMQQGGCVIATACMGETSDEVASLRRLRDDAITSDPIARDFFHVFWSRYYEWSPSVARIAAQDPAVAEHIRWGFLDPWLAWLEFASAVGQRGVADLSDDERRETLERLGARLESWLAELPALMEGKCPADASQVFAAFERFRTSARKVFNA
jgi:hypothetical protein